MREGSPGNSFPRFSNMNCSRVTLLSLSSTRLEGSFSFIF